MKVVLFPVGDHVKRLCPGLEETGESLLTIVYEEGRKFAAVQNAEDAYRFAAAREMEAALDAFIGAYGFGDTQSLRNAFQLAQSALSKARNGS